MAILQAERSGSARHRAIGGREVSDRNEIPSKPGIYLVTLRNQHPISVNRQDKRIAEKAIKVRCGHVKIGMAANLARRRSNYVATFDVENVIFRPLLTCSQEDAEQCERVMKERLRDFRIRGLTGQPNEWLEGIGAEQVVEVVWRVVEELGFVHEPFIFTGDHVEEGGDTKEVAMIYDPATGALYDARGSLLKILHCPKRMRWEELTDIEDKERRLCEACWHEVRDLSELNEDEAVRFLRVTEGQACVRLSQGQRGLVVLRSDQIGQSIAAEVAQQRQLSSEREQNSELPVIETARDWASINEAAARGYWPLVQRIQDPRTSQVRSLFCTVQNTETGEIDIFRDPRQRPADDKWKVVIDWTHDFTTPSACPVAAYLVPKGLPVGTRVVVADLIPDCLGRSLDRARRVPATWNGSDFEFEWPEPDFSIVG